MNRIFTVIVLSCISVIHGLYNPDYTIDSCVSCRCTVYISNVMGNTEPFHCAGGLITRQLVITSAYCYTKETYPGERTAILAGAKDIISGGELYYVTDHRFLDPVSNPKQQLFNVAVLKLDRFVYFQKYVMPVPLGIDIDFEPLAYEKRYPLVVSGFGDTNTTLNKLAAVSLNVVDMKYCEKIYPLLQERDVDNYWCTGMTEDNQDLGVYYAEVVDQGAPLLDNDYYRMLGVLVNYEIPEDVERHSNLFYIFPGPTRKKIFKMMAEMS